MDLSDALGGPWPGNPQPSNPSWPGNPQPSNPSWPAGGSGGAWPGAPSGGGSGDPWPGAPSGGGSGGPWPGAPSGGGGPQPVGPSAGPQTVGPIVQPSKPLVGLYSYPFPGGFHDKLLITIFGKVNHNPNKFTVDLHTDRDLAFHFNPRFNENGNKVIVRNSRIDNKWGQEERQLCNFPFAPGESFEMKILCTQKEFRVAVNNSHLFEFKHRITNLRLIKQLCIHHDVSVQGFNTENLP
ncbi:galectin-3b isoform X3 [Epinephelus moara]|uniref:galectin-3b isoform X3 n=1 Tax=Epinephelus moara TaxID=300413 RepID=UPI00214E83B5|nr:galectin-3b isoform X3 [Epinephelus moara]XP_049917882.1 galectin-3b isoform X3 [Epinephelus moara]